MKKVTIYGERCSGTNYIEELLKLNFDVEIIWDYGWKHFFGFDELTNCDDVLFIGIIRNLPDWVNSLYREKYHLPESLTNDVDSFLTNTFYSVVNGEEHMGDRNIETNERYTNIFELRHIKNKFLVETMPTLVKNYCLILYDDLCNDFTGHMNKLREYGLVVKPDIEFPQNVTYYKKCKRQIYVKKENTIPTNIIMEKANLYYEKILFPNIVLQYQNSLNTQVGSPDEVIQQE
jgi:hypothetical protein